MIGLLLASLDAIVNALTDAFRKKVLDRQFDASLISVWCKIISCLVFGLVIAALYLFWGAHPRLPDIGKGFNLSPGISFLLYVSLNAVLEGTAILLNLRALQVSPMSYCVPFMALTPLFLLPAGAIFLHEAISGGMILGVLMVVIGSLVVNRQLFARGLLEPARAIVRERGSRYMLMVAFLLTITSVLDKWFLTNGGGAASFTMKLSRSLTLSAGKSAMLTVFFVGLTIIRLGKRDPTKNPVTGSLQAAGSFSWTDVLRDSPLWLILAGVFEAMVLMLMLTAMQFTVAAVVISIKRSGVILSVGLGWFMFNERGITDRLIASLVMASGVLIFFLTKPDAHGHATMGPSGAALVALLSLLVMSVALYLTRHHFIKTAAPPLAAAFVESPE